MIHNYKIFDKFRWNWKDKSVIERIYLDDDDDDHHDGDHNDDDDVDDGDDDDDSLESTGLWLLLKYLTSADGWFE